MDTESFENLILYIAVLGNVTFSSGLFVGLFLAFLFFLSGIIAASEVAYFSLTQSQIDQLASDSGWLGSLVAHQLKTPGVLLAVHIVLGSLVNVSIVILSTYISKLFVITLTPLWLVYLAQILAITVVLVFISEFIPKMVANRHSIVAVRISAPLIAFFDIIFKPISYLLLYSTSLVNNRLAKYSRNISIDDLSEALELSEPSHNEEKNILKGIVKFGDTDVCEIMQPRVDVVAADISISYDQLLIIIEESGYSRIPVFEETLDHIKGILYIKDLLPHLTEPADFVWQSLIRPSYYIPESKKIDDLLKEFQVNRIHMAIVIDEYGGTSGIITLEDILEEIVGEITDESDEDELTYEKIDSNNFVFEGKTLLNDFYKVVEVSNTIFDEVKGDADTLAGLILEIRGGIPKLDDKIAYKNFLFCIIAVDKRRIKKIKVTIN